MSKVPVHSAGCHFSIMIFLPFLLMSTLIFALNWQMVTWEESGILLFLKIKAFLTKYDPILYTDMF